MTHSCNDEFDVIVVGSGFAGLTAAIEARNAGASVVVLEKMNAVGGNSVISDGGIAAAGTDLQVKHGISDTPDDLYADMLKAGLGINYPELVRIVVDQAADVFEWSRQYLGVEYLDRVDIFGGHSVPRCYTAKNVSGATIIKKMVEKLDQLGIEVRLQTCLKGIIRDGDGRVCGVRVQRGYPGQVVKPGEDHLIKARRGVILATGGFSSDIPFRSAQDPRLTGIIDSTNKPFATAETLIAALKIGAAPVQLSRIQLGPWASPDEKGYGVGPRFSEYIVFQYGIIVDPATGHRFINELADRRSLADQLLTIGHPCIGLADAAAVEVSGWTIEKCLQKGVVHAFDSLEAAATFYQIPGIQLAATVDRFNAGVKAGADPDFAKPLLASAGPIQTPPYYGVRLWPKVHYTMGGLRIDTQGAVIDLEGQPIQGLYAAGEITGGIHGASRLGSCSITECLVFGRITGRQAASQKPDDQLTDQEPGLQITHLEPGHVQ
jgi:flavocytochrome c